uniref:Pituitary tumor-transforming gene 1 protein-interacting protein-like n=1 Tax=Gasterosteus aculeatus aculeatus TaxID=481459 RepID=A0AAQ4RWC7_GASAC
MSLSKKEGHNTLTRSVVLGAFVLFVSFVSRGECQTTPPPTPCSSYKSCDQCAPNTKCLWCFTTNNCTDYPVSWLLPPPSLCQLSQARWGVCWLNFEGLIIALAVVGGAVLVSIVVCCCCCCCCKKRRLRPDRDEERLVQRREEINSGLRNGNPCQGSVLSPVMLGCSGSSENYM